MRRLVISIVSTVGLVVASAVLAAPQASSARASDQTVLAFETMAPVSGAFVGSSALRGVPGGGKPWIISSGQGELNADGSLEVQVAGLVLDPTAVPAPFGGTNPIPNFKAVVSCLNADGSTTNVSTGPFPASTGGNSEIEATVNLPSPCFAPIVFVSGAIGSGPGPWFAVTGR